MSYGVFQEFLSSNWTLQGNRELTGVIGTTFNGVMYLSMPCLFAIFTKRWAGRRQTAAFCGVVLTCISFLLSSCSTHVWHLIATQGVLAALGCALLYSPTTLSLGEWYRVVLSCKNVVGSTCPFIFRALLDHYDFRMSMRIWTALVGITSILAIFSIPTPPSTLSSGTNPRARKIPWHFLCHAMPRPPSTLAYPSLASWPIEYNISRILTFFRFHDSTLSLLTMLLR